MKIADFEKRKAKIVCIDSDGTALDTMNVKHIRCFGPCFVREWNLERVQEQALKRWNDINLYEKTRGQNRFITLLRILEEYSGTLVQDDLQPLRDFAESGKELSPKSLKRETDQNGAPILGKALRWSDAVNTEIEKLTPDDKKPFFGAEEFLAYSKGMADIAVVSSAGAEALKDEWRNCGLDKYADVMTSQEDGTKAECIRRLIAKGYNPRNMLMVGDSFPDIDSAKECGIRFYPILAGKEKESWEKLRSEYFELFLGGDYESVQDELTRAFYANLNVTI